MSVCPHKLTNCDALAVCSCEPVGDVGKEIDDLCLHLQVVVYEHHTTSVDEEFLIIVQHYSDWTNDRLILLVNIDRNFRKYRKAKNSKQQGGQTCGQ